MFRLGGAARDATAVTVAEEMEGLLSFFGLSPRFGVSANLRHPDGYAHVLSGSAIVGGYTGLFYPVDHQGGTSSLTSTAQSYLCSLSGSSIEAVVTGGPDVVSDETGSEVAHLLTNC